MHSAPSPLPAAPAGWAAHEGTLGRELHVSGRGLHTGRKTTVRILPASGEKGARGIIFRRVSKGAVVAEASARLGLWRKHPLCSSLDGGNGYLFRTVEHVLASLLMCEIDNAVVELDAEEVPILDGGAAHWMRALRACGRVAQSRPKRFIRVKKDFTHTFGTVSDYAISASSAYTVEAKVAVQDFPSMTWRGELTPESFGRDIAPSRSYGHVRWAVPAILGGLAARMPILRGVRPSCVAAILGGRVLGGMTVPEEFARHRVLDMVGDFALAGGPILGAVSVRQPSHTHNQKFMKLFLADSTAWEWAHW